MLTYKLTATVGKKKRTLGTYNKVANVDKVLRKAKELKKTFPFSEKSTIIIQPMRNGKKSGKPRVKKIF